MTEKFDFEKDSTVDPNRLHEECFGYGRMAWRYGEALAEAKRVRDRAWEKVKVVRSELVLKATGDPEGCGLPKKPTGPVIEAYFRTHKRHMDAKQELIEAEYQVGILEAGNASIQFSKSTALEQAVKLWQGEYYSVEGLPAEVPENWKEEQSKRREDIVRKQRQTMTRER